MVVMDRINLNLGLQTSSRWSLYTGGLYIQLNYSEKCIGRTRKRSLYAGGLYMQVVFSTGSIVSSSGFASRIRIVLLADKELQNAFISIIFRPPLSKFCIILTRLTLSFDCHKKLQNIHVID